MPPTTERWKELCREASIEHDSEKLLELVQEINRQIREKYAGPKKVGVDSGNGKQNAA